MKSDTDDCEHRFLRYSGEFYPTVPRKAIYRCSDCGLEMDPFQHPKDEPIDEVHISVEGEPLNNGQKRAALMRGFQKALREIDPDWGGRYLVLELEPDRLELLDHDHVRVTELPASQLEKLNQLLGPRYAVVEIAKKFHAFCPWCDWEGEPLATWAECRRAARDHLTSCWAAIASLSVRRVWVGPFHNPTRVWISREAYIQEMVTAEDRDCDAIVWEPRSIPVKSGRNVMPDKVRAGEGDSAQPCPNPDCPKTSHRLLELVDGRVRMECSCGAAGAWADDDEDANKNWDKLPRGGG